MKNFLLLSGFLFLSAGALQAQGEPDAAQKDAKVAEKIQNLNIAYISEKLGLTPEQAEKFWPVYREFVQKKTVLHQEVKTFQKSMDAKNPDPQKQRELLTLRLTVRQKEIDLEKEYDNRLLNIVNAQQLLNLHKADKEFRALILNLMQQKRLMQQRKDNFRDQNQRLRQKAN